MRFHNYTSNSIIGPLGIRISIPPSEYHYEPAVLWPTCHGCGMHRIKRLDWLSAHCPIRQTRDSYQSVSQLVVIHQPVTNMGTYYRWEFYKTCPSRVAFERFVREGDLFQVFERGVQFVNLNFRSHLLPAIVTMRERKFSFRFNRHYLFCWHESSSSFSFGNKNITYFYFMFFDLPFYNTETGPMMNI